MKFSMFNVITEINEDEYLLSNTMTGSMYKIDANVRDRIITNDFSSFLHEDLEEYRKSGVIINDDVDEYQKFMYFSSKSQFGSNTLNITLFLTNNCNLRCTYCFQSHNRENNVMSEEVLEKIFEYIKSSFKSNKNLNALSFVMFGGEPLLTLPKYKYFFDIEREYCKQNKYSYSTQIVTNGVLINENNLKMLIENNCRNIQITLDGVKEVHDKTRKFRNGKGSFESVVKGIRLVQSHKELPPPVIRINITKENYDRVIDLIEYLEIHRLNRCYVDFGIVFDSNNSSGNGAFDEESIKGKMPKLWRVLKDKKFYFDVRPSRKWLYCGAYCESHITIDVDGSLYKCWDVVKEEQFKIGNVMNFNDIDIDKYTQWISRSVKVNDKCCKCQYLPVCGFGCANLSYQQNGDINGYGCNKAKWLYDDQIRFILDNRRKENHEENQL